MKVLANPQALENQEINKYLSPVISFLSLTKFPSFYDKLHKAFENCTRSKTFNTDLKLQLAIQNVRLYQRALGNHKFDGRSVYNEGATHRAAERHVCAHSTSRGRAQRVTWAQVDQ